MKDKMAGKKGRLEVHLIEPNVFTVGPKYINDEEKRKIGPA